MSRTPLPYLVSLSAALGVVALAGCSSGSSAASPDAGAPDAASPDDAPTTTPDANPPSSCTPAGAVVRTYLKASKPVEHDQFGYHIALSADGSTLAIGAPGPSGAEKTASRAGAVYVFVHGSGTWRQQAYLKASNTDAGDQFGLGVALSADGSTLAVGATGESSAAAGVDGDQADNTADQSGAVYVFVRSGATWGQQAYLKASNPDANDLFGIRLALAADGSTLAVGAPGERSAATGVDGDQTDNSTAVAGAVYVFARDAQTWRQQAYLKASNTGTLDAFGARIALSASGATLAVGAFQESSGATGVDGDQADDSAADAGAVYVFARDAQTWRQQAYLKASNTGAGDRFGSGLAVSGDGATLAVGAPHEGGLAGAVYVFARDATTWAQQAYVKASESSTAGLAPAFGGSVALSDDGSVLAVGSVGESSAATGIDGDEADRSALSAGAAYRFTRSGGTWQRSAYIKASNTGATDNLGASVALSGDGATLAAAAPGESSAAAGVCGDQADNSLDGAGAVYVFERSSIP